MLIIANNHVGQWFGSIVQGSTGVAEAMDKVREGEAGNRSRSQPGLPGTGREGGLGHDRERSPLATI